MSLGIVITICATIVAITVGALIAIRLAERKKPVFAYESSKVIGLGTDAPSQLKLLFGNKTVPEVYRTYVVFFNRGNKAIKRDDVTKPISIVLRGSEILAINRLITSKNEIAFVAKQSSKGADTIDIGFDWLDHNDGGLMEVLHTGCVVKDKKLRQIECNGYVLESGQPRFAGIFSAHRPRRFMARFLVLAFFLVIPTALGIFMLLQTMPEASRGNSLVAKFFISVVLGGYCAQLIWGSKPLFRHLMFPKWCILKD